MQSAVFVRVTCDHLRCAAVLGYDEAEWWKASEIETIAVESDWWVQFAVDPAYSIAACPDHYTYCSMCDVKMPMFGPEALNLPDEGWTHRAHAWATFVSCTACGKEVEANRAVTDLMGSNFRHLHCAIVNVTRTINVTGEKVA